ncbi:uncharacterized protein AB675_12065 [Cyphellophora attinorum]|uniref:Non-haem dioxygenase N-terminal domain-containing protein n=1 Tax=Cyphellophora attinorum TaxID=1664694 RepID=A0A0N1HMD3_9EURO|nr:uncharacterized protein AB675_12065 [Phialophora attinorum]KPI38414.1 hypothetical protein AB675_12065 [Phialophora attinorum]
MGRNSIIDLSIYEQPDGKHRLAKQLRNAVHTTGFFSVINTGLDQAEVDRQYDIAQAFFELSLEEKNKPEYRCDFAAGNYFGYRRAHEKRIMGTEVLNIEESFNIPKFIPNNANEPFHSFFEQYRDEIEAFSRKAIGIADRIFTLFAIILELPEDYFSSRHRYDDPSDDHLRYMVYHPRSVEDDQKVQNTWSRAHTDFGSLTLLWSQDVAGLQLKTPNGDWKYSTTHRVVRPPPDQDEIHRLGLFYFVRPGDDTDIKPAPSPLLKRMGLIPEDQENAKPVRGLEYVRERVKDYHNHMNYADKKGQKFKVGNLEIEDEAT